MPEPSSEATSRSLRTQKPGISPSRWRALASRHERWSCFYLRVRPRSAAGTGTSPAWTRWRGNCCLCDLVSKSGCGWRVGERVGATRWIIVTPVEAPAAAATRPITPAQLINSGSLTPRQPIKSPVIMYQSVTGEGKQLFSFGMTPLGR